MGCARKGHGDSGERERKRERERERERERKRERERDEEEGGKEPRSARRILKGRESRAGECQQSPRPASLCLPPRGVDPWLRRPNLVARIDSRFGAQKCADYGGLSAKRRPMQRGVRLLHSAGAQD